MADKPKTPTEQPAEEQSPAAQQPEIIEHPRRLRPSTRRYGDKVLRPGRVTGGFDTKN